MLNKKKVIMSLEIILIIFVAIFVEDYIGLNLSYGMNKYEEVFLVQGNKDKYVPQGMTYSSKYNVVLQTSYSGKHEVSMLYVIDFSSGELIKSLKLFDINGMEDKSHVGGIATDNNIVWISSDYSVREYSLEDIIKCNEDYIRCRAVNNLGIRGDFCYYGYDTLYIGDFCYAPFYKVPDDNPLLLAYRAQNNYNYDIPDYIISLPKKVQGMTVLPNNNYAFTCSFTNLVQSDLKVYRNVLNEYPDEYYYKGTAIPYYKFSDTNSVMEAKLPPMAEGMFNINYDLYILFENSSDKYFYAFPKMKGVIKYKL